MTGRRAGFCAGNAVPGFANPVPGRGFWGWGRGGGGRGWRHRFHATGLTGWQRAAWGWPGVGPGTPAVDAPPPVSPEQELDLLKQQVQGLSQMLEQLNARITELQPQQN